MTTNGRRKKTNGSKTILILVPFHTAAFLDLLCRYVDGPKQDMYERIWSAGIEAVFGITEEELTECQPGLIPPDIEPPREDLRKLTDLICGE